MTPVTTAARSTPSRRPSMFDCAHARDGRCTHPDQPWGSRPTRAVCRGFCEHRVRFRGLGDVVALAISWLPFRRVKAMQLPISEGGCSRCHERQDALNETVNFRRCGSCARSAPQSQETAQGG